ncbi:ABC transporter substrate-binding protein [Castellaniella sp.]|uniref:ABC transporter substrate-binding protein n=1 Tax=Castellaniella sp. TaxID=1955812 RepID=UPI003C75DA6A
MRHSFNCSAVGAGLLLAFSGAAAAADVRVMCYQDGIECEVTADLAKQFEAKNPGVHIIVDTVPFRTILEQLPVQLAAGRGPDIARVTDLNGLSKYYLDISPYIKDRQYWDTNFASTASWLRPSPDAKGIYGFMSQLTLTAPFVNKTLFEQANVALPGPKATWDDWVQATRKVAEVTKVKAAMAWDRSGHRFAGPAISYGAAIFDKQGELTIDDGYATTVRKFVGWNKDGTMLRDVWVGSGGSTYADSLDEFINGNVVMVLSGSWQISRLQKNIGDAFDWVAVPNPCGTAACSGMPGGAAWVPLKVGKSHKEAAAFLDFMASEPAYAEFTSRTNNIPAHAGLVAKGVAYPGADREASDALKAISATAPSVAPAAYRLQGYKYNRAIMLPTVTRVTQAIVGELTVDEAIERIRSDMKEALRQARQ